MDRNGDLAIDAKEFAMAVEGLGGVIAKMTQKEKFDMFRTADLNNDGLMEFDEFELWIKRTRANLASFRSVDTDKDGMIDVKEWQAMIATLDNLPVPRRHLNTVFSSLDSNEDGLISFGEFAKWMDQPRRRGPRAIFSWLFGR